MMARTTVSPLRGRLLQTVFQLLYTRLGFLHETTGRLVYGPAWDRRRRHVLSVDVRGIVLDLGCGEGRLLASVADRQLDAIGAEPSPEMSRRARERDVKVIRATAQRLPIRSATIQHLIATYPGPWILDSRTWAEIARVTASGATVQILLGGDVRRGSGALPRRWLIRLAYGGRGGVIADLPALGNDLVVGRYEVVEDEWGQAVVWTGLRLNGG